MKNVREERKKLRKKIDKEYEWLTRKYLDLLVKEGETPEAREWLCEAVGFGRAVKLIDNKYAWGIRFDEIFERLEDEYGVGGYNIIENNRVYWIDKLTGEKTFMYDL